MPRPYYSEKRKRSQAELRERIIAATAELHAEKGGAATSYKDIAERADVAVPSVYKHFPTSTSLFSACTALAAARAPRLSLQALASLRTLERKIASMVEMRCRTHEYFHPWLRWGGDRVIPEVVALIERDSDETKQAVAGIIAPAMGRRLREEESRMVLLLLNYHSWAGLAVDQRLPRDQVVRLLAGAIRRILAV